MGERAGRGAGWREAMFAVVDFETTSLNHRKARPLSVGWAPISGGRLVLGGAGYTRIRHTEPIPTASIAVHRLVPEDLVAAAPSEAAGRRVAEVLRGRALVTHGAHHELAMLKRCGVRWRHRDTIDTIRLLRCLERLEGWAPARHYALGSVARRFELPIRRPHHAFGDVLTIGSVFLALATRLERHGHGLTDDLLRVGRPGVRERHF